MAALAGIGKFDEMLWPASPVRPYRLDQAGNAVMPATTIFIVQAITWL